MAAHNKGCHHRGQIELGESLKVRLGRLNLFNLDHLLTVYLGHRKVSQIRRAAHQEDKHAYDGEELS